MNTLQDLIKKYASQYKEQVVEWRRHIHSHPELSGEEKNTSLFIQKVLGELGIPFVNDVSDYAVIGKIEGVQPCHLHHKTMVLCMLVVMIATWQSCLVQQRFYSLLKINCTAL